MGSPQAITATAYKMARILCILITTGKEYNEEIPARADARHRERQPKLRRLARKPGFDPLTREGTLA